MKESGDAMQNLEISYANQRDIFNPKEWAWPVHIVGLGGIGSSLVLPLVKVGVQEVHLWDNDSVEPHNIPAQMIYRKSDIGKQKVEAVREIIDSYDLPIKLVVHDRWVTSETKLEGVVMSGVDSMSSRQMIWETIKFNPRVPLYLDGRIGAEYAQLLSVNPTNPLKIALYEDWLFPEEEGTQLSCSARTIIHSPLQVTTWMITNLTLYARGEPYEENLLVNLKGMQYMAGVR